MRSAISKARAWGAVRFVLLLCLVATGSAKAADNTPESPALHREPLASAPTRPEIMHLCADHCGTATWQNGHYVRDREILTVESFTVDRVVLRSTTPGIPPAKPVQAVYYGQLSPEGDSIVDGTVTWTTGGDSGTTFFTATWGASIDFLPADDHTIPTQFVECEGGRCDGSWTFQGRHGLARWQGGAMAKLVVARYGRAGVVIQRIDWTGRSAGLTAVYTGQIHGSRIEGDVTWSWWGHFKQPAVGTWSATFGGGEARPSTRAPGPALPTTPHSRELFSPTMPKATATTRAFKFDLAGDWGGNFDSPRFFDLIRISQKGSELVAEKLRDDRTPTGRLLFRGAYDPPAETGHVQLAEYDSEHWPNPVRWLDRQIFAGDPDHFRIGAHPPFERVSPPRLNDVPCQAGNPLQVQAKFATFRGMLAHNAKDWPTALCWFRIAAEQDDSYAQFVLASYFEQGIGTSTNLEQAFFWLKKSADGGDFRGAAGLAKMYRTGIGAPQDSALADGWRLREQALHAQETNDLLIAQEGEKREASELARLISFSAFFGAALLGSSSPIQCKIVDSYQHSRYHSSAEMEEVIRAQREIREQNISCP